MKRVLIAVGLVLLVGLGALILLNLNSLDDGILYLQDMLAYSPTPAHPLDPNGKFAVCEQIVSLRNAQRARFITNYLDEHQIAYERLPIFNSGFDNIWVPFSDTGPYTIFSAHYDKRFDDPEYQGASDNSAAVCMLLVAAGELGAAPPAKPVGILFTGEEEVGLVGAQAFYDYATSKNVPVAEVFNFDNIGRGGLASRASGSRSGYTFFIPLLGEFTYDGRTIEPSTSYRQPHAELVRQIRDLIPFTHYDRMVANSDGTVFDDRGWRAINLSSDDIYYLVLTWHTYGDRIELLEQDNLERALELVNGLAQQSE